MPGFRRAALITGFVAVPAFIIAGGYVWWHPQADDFLGDADFEGAPITAPAVTAGMQSTYNGVLTISNLDRGLVESLLPTGFRLAKNKSLWLKKKHPVLLLYGDQTDGATFVGGVVTPAPALDRGHYSEAILAIPYVQWDQQSGWHTYIVRMYLDNLLAVQGGALYGYAKELGCLDWRGAIVKIWQQPVTCPGTNPLITKDLFEGDYRFIGTWYDGNDALGKLRNLEDMVGMVTTRTLGMSGSTPRCSFFEWNLDDARIARARTQHTFKAPFRSDMSAWPGLGQLQNVDQGAVVVRGVRWRLGPAPVPCNFS